jgi:hypothetical protein
MDEESSMTGLKKTLLGTALAGLIALVPGAGLAQGAGSQSMTASSTKTETHHATMHHAKKHHARRHHARMHHKRHHKARHHMKSHKAGGDKMTTTTAPAKPKTKGK